MWSTVEAFIRKNDCFSKDMATWLSTFEDELDIVGEATIDESVKTYHLGGPYYPYCYAPLLNVQSF